MSRATDPQAPTLAHEDTQPESTLVSSESLPSAVFAELPVVPRDHYKIVRELAHGGIGKITVAVDLRLGREVAIKELKGATRYAKERFAREILIGAKLQHPNIVPVHEAGRWPNGEPFFSMKLVKGESLEEAIGAGGDREARMQLLRHVSDVADAIAYAHSQGVVHRDLKPANVLVGPFGETVVIDWGLAKDVHDGDDVVYPSEPLSSHPAGQYQTADGVIVGTPSYMAPEQAAGQPVDARTDVYALGAILYHVLSGRAPYDDTRAQNILARVLRGPPTPLADLEPDLPRDLTALVAKAMAREPAERYPSAREMAEELEAFIAGGLVAAYRYSLRERAWRFVRRHRAVVATAGMALVALVAFGIWSFARIAEQRDRAEHERERAERSAIGESGMRQEAERRLDVAVLEAARAALPHDPTLALARLKRLVQPLAGAASVAADAEERGVAERVLAGHDDLVDALAVSADGRFVASASRDGRIRVWDRDKDAVRVLAGHSERVPAIAFSPKEPLLASAGYDGRVLLWKIPSGDKRALLEGKAPMRALAFDGARVAAVGDDGAHVWRLAGGEAVHLAAPADRPLFALFDGDALITGSHERSLRRWDLTSKEAVTHADHQGEIRDAARSPRGAIASAGEDGTIVVRDGQTTTTLRGHRGSVEAVAFFPDGTLASGGSDGTLRIWDEDKSDIVVQHAERIADVIVSPDGLTLASASWDRTIALFDRQSRTTRRLAGHRDVVAALAFSPDSRTLASASWDQEVRIWPLARDRRRVLRGHQVGVKAVAFAPNAQLIASAGHDDTVRLWRSNGELVRVLEGHRDHVFRVRFSPNGRHVASSSDDRSVRLWSVEGDEHHVLEGHRADVEELAFSRDGKWLASAGEDGAVGLWNVASASGRLLEGHGAAVTAVAFHGDELASASRDRTIRLWRAGKERAILRGHRGEVTHIAFTHASNELVSTGSDDTLRIWNLAKQGNRTLGGTLRGAAIVAISPDDRLAAVASTRSDVWLCPLAGGPCRTLTGHAARVHALAFSPDGKWLATASGDATVRLYDVESSESRPYRGHTAPVFDVAFSPTGGLLASASADATVRLWPLAPPPAPQDLQPFLQRATTFTATP